MEKVFVKAVYNRPFAISKSLKAQFENIPDKIGLISTVQFSNLLPIIKKQLEELGKEVYISGEGTVLGCNAENAKKIFNKVDAFIYIGSGKFHPLQVALLLNKTAKMSHFRGAKNSSEFFSKKRIYNLYPQAEEIIELDWKEVEAFKVRKDVAKIKAMSSDKLGLLVSIKPGQCNLSGALKFKEKFDRENKKAYIFLFDSFDESQIENWNELVYVNTACPGLALDKKFADLGDLD